ncbi:GGDEF domain-containing protein [Comamonas guangdongensis]|uniref:diguanylate cyclase n=1 Tax=Comamonas guangdongensis TaxID=510515 RepID=A0ABV3ZVU1_9BURK
MSAADDRIFLLAPSLAMLFLAGLLGICWLNQRQQRFLLWLCSAYALTALYLGIRSLLSPEDLDHHATGIGTLYLLGSWCLARSFAERRRVSTHPGLALLIGLVALAALFYFTHIDQNFWDRLYSFNLGIALILLLPVSDVFKKPRAKDWLNQTLLWSYITYALFTMARPLLVSLWGHTGLGGAMQPNSLYWATTLMSVLFFALLFTVLICAVTMRDIVSQLRSERDHDALTKTLNRRAFNEAARLRLADQRLHPIAILAGDIDHFKRINDGWGHERGDRVLQLVSATLQRNVRSPDLVARFGGEEFVLLLKCIDLAGAGRLAQRIRLELGADNTVLPHEAQLTMSFGISAVKASAQLDSALKEADRLMYSAKNAGRDRAHTAGVLYPDAGPGLQMLAATP